MFRSPPLHAYAFSYTSCFRAFSRCLSGDLFCFPIFTPSLPIARPIIFGPSLFVTPPPTPSPHPAISTSSSAGRDRGKTTKIRSSTTATTISTTALRYVFQVHIFGYFTFSQGKKTVGRWCVVRGSHSRPLSRSLFLLVFCWLFTSSLPFRLALEKIDNTNKGIVGERGWWVCKQINNPLDKTIPYATLVRERIDGKSLSATLTGSLTVVVAVAVVFLSLASVIFRRMFNVHKHLPPRLHSSCSPLASPFSPFVVLFFWISISNDYSGRRVDNKQQR